MTSLAQLLKYQKELNVNSTIFERQLVGRLRNAGFRVKTQVIVAPFIVDILIPRKMLIIEVDGSVHDSQIAQQRDASRTEYLRRVGFTVLRVRNADVKKRSVIEEVSNRPDVIGRRSKRLARLLGSLMAKRNIPSGPVKGRGIRRSIANGNGRSDKNLAGHVQT